MAAEERYFHLGLDIIVPLHAELRTPLDAVVEEAGYEEGDGNYGGYVLLRHERKARNPSSACTVTWNGHPCPRGRAAFRRLDLCPHRRSSRERRLVPSHPSPDHHGGGAARGLPSQGVLFLADMTVIDRYCPDPVPLFRVR
jgi:hypothetical protein